MNANQFIEAYSESRNGTDGFFYHPMVPYFHYSTGMRECAETGCYWLIDLLALGLNKAFFLNKQSYLCIVQCDVEENGKTLIKGEFFDDDPNPWKKKLIYSTLPEGKWTFYIALEGNTLKCILPSEY